eukprot:TRINITY_DN15282_c3_g1_i1.p1 TRINITY_DN15282_c3_g1~~TRINITY_DN15282_c3_g1_i1.p1  ORF type:complete len:360 (+),score=68.33 TRINITY_DN15282_c3_g1_i1:46-1125(+)
MIPQVQGQVPQNQVPHNPIFQSQQVPQLHPQLYHPQHFYDLPMAVSVASCPASPSGASEQPQQHDAELLPLPAKCHITRVSSLVSAMSDDIRKLSVLSSESDFQQAISSSDLSTPDHQAMRASFSGSLTPMALQPPGSPSQSLITATPTCSTLSVTPAMTSGTPAINATPAVSAVSNTPTSTLSTPACSALTSTPGILTPITISVSSLPCSGPCSPENDKDRDKEEIVKDPSKARKDRPCKHNQWRLMKKGKKKSSNLDPLRCLVCGKDWLTDLKRYHEKCEDFYNGTCKGRCKALHLYRSGSQPKEEDEMEAWLPPGWEPNGRRVLAVNDEGYYRFSHYPAHAAELCESTCTSCVHHY